MAVSQKAWVFFILENTVKLHSKRLCQNTVPTMVSERTHFHTCSWIPDSLSAVSSSVRWCSFHMLRNCMSQFLIPLSGFFILYRHLHLRTGTYEMNIHTHWRRMIQAVKLMPGMRPWILHVHLGPTQPGTFSPRSLLLKPGGREDNGASRSYYSVSLSLKRLSSRPLSGDQSQGRVTHSSGLHGPGVQGKTLSQALSFVTEPSLRAPWSW